MTRPFLESWIEILRNELHWDGNIIIISSSYNHSLLESLEKYENVTVKQHETRDLFQYERKTGKVLTKIWKIFLLEKKRLWNSRESERKRLFIDLVDSITEGYCPQNFGEFPETTHWTSANRGPFTWLLDAPYRNRYSGGNENLIQNIISHF